jgi:hypothetical protein
VGLLLVKETPSKEEEEERYIQACKVDLGSFKPSSISSGTYAKTKGKIDL